MANFDFDDSYSRSSGQSIATQMSKVYGWMFIGLIITAITAYVTASSPMLLSMIYSSRLVFIGLIIGEMALVWFLSSRAMNMEYGTAAICFGVYSVLNGLTLASIFIAFTRSSIAGAFFITAAVFGIMSVYGLVTKTDLTTFGNIMIMGLVGILVASIVNFFIQSPSLYWIISYIGVAVFMGLIAYDSQKIKNISQHYTGTHRENNIAILGALILYLDFINLFLFILRIIGRRR